MFSSMRLRAFLMAFTSAFLCFIVFWMAVLLTNPTAVSSSRQQEEVPLEQQGGSLYLPTKSDCMTLLLCEEGLEDLRWTLGLNENSRVLCISTEGDTDRKNYRRVLDGARF